MALKSTQPLTEMSTRCISWDKGGRCLRLTTLPPSCAVIMKSGNLNFQDTSGSITGLLYLYIYIYLYIVPLLGLNNKLLVCVHTFLSQAPKILDEVMVSVPTETIIYSN
jgi:hypothetical protein